MSLMYSTGSQMPVFWGLQHSNWKRRSFLQESKGFKALLQLPAFLSTSSRFYCDSPEKNNLWLKLEAANPAFKKPSADHI